MKYLNKFLIFCFIVFSFEMASAQFAINGELRTKTMFLDGYKQLFNGSQNPYGLIVQRSRLLLDYKKDQISFGFSVQDVRKLGTRPYFS